MNQFSMYVYKTHTHISFKLDIVLDLLRIALIFKKNAVYLDSPNVNIYHVCFISFSLYAHAYVHI